MEIKKCFEILEIDPNASIDEAKQAYKDIVNVWHPDRFCHNDRLKEKAEKKLKDVNIAYETLTSFLSSKKRHWLGSEQAPQTKKPAKEKAKTEAKGGSEDAYQNSYGETEARDKIEVAAEAGTRIFLEACSFLYTSLRRIIEKQVINAEPKNQAGPKGPNQSQRRYRARARGMGRQRGKGRGTGKGRGR